jgi:hypothetical protein
MHVTVAVTATASIVSTAFRAITTTITAHEERLHHSVPLLATV